DLILCHAANVNCFGRGLDRRILTNCLIPDPPKDELTHSLPLVSACRLNPSMSLTSPVARFAVANFCLPRRSPWRRRVFCSPLLVKPSHPAGEMKNHEHVSLFHRARS